jgi:hypothetical protein
VPTQQLPLCQPCQPPAYKAGLAVSRLAAVACSACQVRLTDAPLNSSGALRSQVVKSEGERIEKLAREEIDGRFLAMRGRVGAARAVLNQMRVKAERAVRAVVSNVVAGIRLTPHSDAGSAAAATLTPTRAIGLDDWMLDAAFLELLR